MSRFQVTDYPTSPSEQLTYSFSCLEHTQTQYHTSYREARQRYTYVKEQYEAFGNLMTLIHFYD
jgi:hypothetical protein